VLTVEGLFTATYEVKRSLFIGNICGVGSKQAAVAFIRAQKVKYSVATHNVYAFILQAENLQKSSDDHEPKGTAGPSVLNVLQNQQLTNVVLVVTRYFGGILLGAGGLVRAYSAAAQTVIKCASLVPLKVFLNIEIIINYSLFNRVENIFAAYDVVVVETMFLDCVHIKLKVSDETKCEFKTALFDVCSGDLIWHSE
jgi:uncharacterized YigZ family protein